MDLTKMNNSELINLLMQTQIELNKRDEPKKIIINNSYTDCLILSRKAVEYLSKMNNLPEELVNTCKQSLTDKRNIYCYFNVQRDNPYIIRVIEELGTDEASGNLYKLQVNSYHKIWLFDYTINDDNVSIT